LLEFVGRINIQEEIVTAKMTDYIDPETQATDPQSPVAAEEEETSEPVPTDEPDSALTETKNVAPVDPPAASEGDLEQQTAPAPAAALSGEESKEEAAEGDRNKAASPVATGDAAAGAAKKKATGPKKEINPKFKDVRETGKWGSVSKTEVFLVVVAISLVVIGAVIAVVLIAIRSNQDPPSPAGPPPTMPPTQLSAEMELAQLKSAIDFGDFTFPIADALSDNVEDYVGKMDDPTASAPERAMSWILTNSMNNVPGDLVTRWALASIYYSMGGENWVNKENWLSEESHCEWFGVECDRFGALEELILKENKLAGTIPMELSLFSDMQSLWWSTNALTGTLPGDMLGSLPRLSILYLNENKLTGTIPDSLRNNGVLRKWSLGRKHVI
jgi:hypothetical protein